MEILILAVLGLVFTLTVLVVVLKLLIALVLIPFKLLGAILGGAAKLAVAAALLFVGLVVLALLPVLVPVAIVSGVAAMSVNPAEYDPTTADLEHIVASRRIGATSNAVVSSDDLIARRMQQVEIWPLLLAGAVLLLVIECGLLVVGRARASAVGGAP